MINTALRVALYEPRSGLAGITVSQFNTLLQGGSNPDMIDTTQRVALYPPRSGLPGATLQAIIDQAGGGGGACLGERTLSTGDSLANINTPGLHPTVKGEGRSWIFVIYSIDNVVAAAPNILSVTINGEVFNTAFRIGEVGNPGGNQNFAVWRVLESDFITPPDDVENTTWNVISDTAVAGTQTVVKAIQYDVPTSFNFSNSTAFSAIGGPFAWPESSLETDDFGMVVYGSIDNSPVLVTDPAGTVLLDTQVVTGAGTDKNLNSNIFPAGSNGDTTGALIRFATHLFATAV